MNWQPIETAPKDGRPIWVKGNNYGRVDGGAHYGWAFYLDEEWRGPSGAGEMETYLYLTHWLAPEPPKD